MVIFWRVNAFSPYSSVGPKCMLQDDSTPVQAHGNVMLFDEWIMSAFATRFLSPDGTPLVPATQIRPYIRRPLYERGGRTTRHATALSLHLRPSGWVLLAVVRGLYTVTTFAIDPHGHASPTGNSLLGEVAPFLVQFGGCWPNTRPRRSILGDCGA